MDNSSEDILQYDSSGNSGVGHIENVRAELVGDCVVITLYDTSNNIIGLFTHDIYLSEVSE